MCSIVASGIFKMACAFVAGPIRRLVPRAALLGSLTAIALALITFLPLLEVFLSPIAGLVALGIVLATLTAHMQIALGDHMSGVVGDDTVVADVVAAGEAAGELHWPMPIPEAMVERIKSSKVADLSQHDWIRWGGGLFASAFLREFTRGLPWAHLDIAGPAFNSGGPQGHWTSGGTGFAVATLVEYARRAGAAVMRAPPTYGT